MSFLSAQLLSPPRFFAQYFIPHLPSNPLEWKSGRQLLQDECGARLARHAPGCSVPRRDVWQPYAAFMTAMNHWSNGKQPKHSCVFGFCHLLGCFLQPRLSEPWGRYLSERRHTENGPNPKLALAATVCSLPLASSCPAVCR